MPRLVVPTAAVHRSYLAAWDEFDDDGAHWMGAFAADEHRDRDALADPAEFARLVADLARDTLPEALRPADYVPSTHLWFVEGDEWLGRLSVRHELNPFLSEIGGHIGYVVRPTARGHGHATRMLTQSLPIAADLGIDPALVTCDTGNLASRKVIEAAGGELEDERHDKLRFWVPTHVS